MAVIFVEVVPMMTYATLLPYILFISTTSWVTTCSKVYKLLQGEIGRRSGGDNVLEREGYAVSAGFSLGLVVLGKFYLYKAKWAGWVDTERFFVSIF